MYAYIRENFVISFTLLVPFLSVRYFILDIVRLNRYSSNWLIIRIEERGFIRYVAERVCRLCSVLKCFMFLSSLPFMAYNIIGFPGISMGLFSDHGPCLEHDHELLRPIIVSTWMPEKVGGLPGKSLVFAESQVN